MRRKALIGGVVAAAAVSLSAAATLGQTTQTPPAAAQKPPPPARPAAVDPKWKVQPAPPPPATAPILTQPSVRGYSQFDILIEPREWPRDDPVNRMPETPGDRQDSDFGLDSAKAYDSTRPEDPLGPY